MDIKTCVKILTCRMTLALAWLVMSSATASAQARMPAKNEAKPPKIVAASKEVAEVQKALNETRPEGTLALAVDGIEGPMTKYAKANWKRLK